MTDRLIDAARRQAEARQSKADNARFRVAALPALERDRLHFEIARALHAHNPLYKLSPQDAILAARDLMNAWDAAEAKPARQWPAPKATP